MADHPDLPSHIDGWALRPSVNGPVSPDVDLEMVWSEIAAEVWAPPIRSPERLARLILRSPALARSLVTTPSLRLSWIVASAVIRATGILFTYTTDNPWVALLAPALAGAGIAYAYGPGIDPAFELSQTMPVSDRMILLVRGLAVCGLNAVLCLIASLFIPGALSLTLGWFLPMTMVSALALAGATLARDAKFGVAAAIGGWSLIVLAAAAPGGDLAAATAPNTLAPIYVMGTAVCIGLALYATDGQRQRKETFQWE